MKRLPAFLCSLLVLSCSRPAGPGQVAMVTLVPSRERVFAQSDSEPAVTSWLPLGLSYPSAGSSILYGLLIADGPVLDAAHKPTGETLRRGSRVTLSDATAWQPAGREYRRWYKIRRQGPDVEAWLDSQAVALITEVRGALSGGFLERKIAIAGGESEYNVLVLCDGSAVSLIDTSALVFADSFHPSGVTHLSIEDVNSNGVLSAVVKAQTIGSLQFLGASPLSWEAWLREKDGSWGAIFRFNAAYGTDQGNSYSATRRAFSSTGTGTLDTVKVTTDLVETTAQGVFSTTIVTFFLWNGTLYKEDPDRELPQEGSVIANAVDLRSLPQGDGAPVAKLHNGDALYVFDRGDTQQSVEGQSGFWLHATTHAGKEGWVHSSAVKLTRIDPLKVNRDVFLGKSGFSAPSDQSAIP
ncbi:MAG: SH3 domain-containing protein [Spirochaetia bacterium]